MAYLKMRSMLRICPFWEFELDKTINCVVKCAIQCFAIPMKELNMPARNIRVL